jgi:transposase-like protein
MAMQVRVITKQQNASTHPTTCNQCPARAEVVIEIETEDADERPYWLGEYLCRDCAKNIRRIIQTARFCSMEIEENAEKEAAKNELLGR